MERKIVDLKALQAYRKDKGIGHGWDLADLLMHTFPGVTCVAYEDTNRRGGVWMKELKTFMGSRHAAPRSADCIIRSGADEIEVPVGQVVVDHIAHLRQMEAAKAAADIAIAEEVHAGTYRDPSRWMEDAAASFLTGRMANGQAGGFKLLAKDYTGAIVEIHADTWNGADHPYGSPTRPALPDSAFPILMHQVCRSNKYIYLGAIESEQERLRPIIAKAIERHKAAECDRMRRWAQEILVKAGLAM